MGDVAGRYELREPLGSGGGGAVFAAFDRLLDRKVAVKLYKLPSANDASNMEMLQRFRIGAKAAGRLSHPNIVPIFDYGEDVERAWIVMELVEGASLKALLDQGERYDFPAVLRIMDHILAALEYSHRAGVVHRDVKPSNTMMTHAGVAKLTDFGVARIQDYSMTMVGSMIGTPAYMAPEQFGGTIDHRADIWAAGAVFYELLTGERAFAGEDFGTIMRKVMSDDPPPPSRRARLPPAIDAVVARALEKNAEDRYASAAEFASALRDLHAFIDAPTMVQSPRREEPRPNGRRPSNTRRRPAPSREGRRSKRMLALGGGLVLGSAAAVALLLLNRAPKNPAPVQPAMAQGTPAPTRSSEALQPTPTQQFLLPPEPPPDTARTTEVVPTAVPTPAPATARAPAPAPTPVPTAVSPPRLDFRGIAQQIVQSTTCGLLTSASDDERVVLSGVVRRADAAAAQRALAGARVPDAAMRLNFNLFDADYCGMTQVLRAAADSTAAPPRMVLSSPNPLLAGQNLRFRVDMPDRPAFLHVFYLTTTGDVGHLVQARQTPYAANAKPEFGEPFWRASEPFGTDLIIAVASDEPLFPTRRRVAERQDEVAAALQSALDRAQASGQRISVSAITQQTSDR